MTRWTLRALAALATTLLIAAGCGGDDDDAGTDLADDSGADEVTGVEREPNPDVSAVALPEASAGDQSFTTVAEDGSLLLVYFGYTSCPDVCPTTLSDVRAVRDDLGEQADQVDLAMVTIDPTRDDGELLTGYVQSFVPEGHALRTEDPAALRAAADAFGADYSVEPGPDGEPEVSHTGGLYVVDDTGHLVLEWPFGVAPEDMTSDLEILLGEIDAA